MYDHEAHKYQFSFENRQNKKLKNKSSDNDTKPNFYEDKVNTYSKQELSWDEFTGMGVVEMNWDYVKQSTYDEAVKEKGTQKVDLEDRSGECVGCQ